MKSVLDVQVSCFRNYYSPNEMIVINLLAWLKSAKYRDQVLELRNEQDKEIRDKLKALLPAVTIFGIFNPRTLAGLVSASYLLCIDIDPKDNPHIKNYNELKTQFAKIRNVAYAGLSASGQGFFLIMVIKYPDKHAEYFELLRIYFGRKGVNIDIKCKDITRLRGYSYDDDPYYNHEAVPLEQYYVEPAQVLPKKRFPLPYAASNLNDAESTINHIIDEIDQSGIDITSDYNTWLAIGCDIASTCGAAGESYFHSISQYYPRYAYQKASKQFAACIKHVAGKPGKLGALVNAAKAHGISIKTRALVVPEPVRILYRDGKRYEVLRDGSLVELTADPPYHYPASWDN